jgi:hypothetical protein
MKVIFTKKQDEISVDDITNEHFILLFDFKDKALYLINRINNDSFNIIHISQSNMYWDDKKYSSKKDLLSKMDYIKDFEIYAFTTYKKWLDKFNELSERLDNE